MNTEIICGVNAVYEALRAGRRRVFEVLIARGKRESTIERIVREAASRKVPVIELDRREIQERSKIEKTQGVAARVAPFSYATFDDVARAGVSASPPGFIVVLDDVIDPQNVGSLVRTAHLTGAVGLIIPRDRAAGIGPAATRASAGAVEHIPIVQVTNLARSLGRLKELGYWIVGADGESPSMLYSYDFSTHPHVLILGGEGGGLRRLVREMCDTALAIPMSGAVGSYNVSVAGAIFMGEINRQRWTKSHAKAMPFGGKELDKVGKLS